jgi:hypothetical protein
LGSADDGVARLIPGGLIGLHEKPAETTKQKQNKEQKPKPFRIIGFPSFLLFAWWSPLTLYFL